MAEVTKPVVAAVALAYRVHIGQMRKATNYPFIVHPIAVGEILISGGCSDDVVAAGVLHDVFEDGHPMYRDFVKGCFSDRVVELVENVTEPPKTMPWKERKQAYLEHFAEADKDTALIVLADKYNNICALYRDFMHQGEKMWENFDAPIEDQKWFYNEVVDILYAHDIRHDFSDYFFELIDEMEDKLNQIFGE